MEEVITCLCGCQGAWQIGATLQCNACKKEYILPISAFEFNKNISVLAIPMSTTDNANSQA